ncbi:MAG: hypothetical protein GY854_21570 [Deltaproteobacteria bacterium]|nr:hypothetical protein [Deltaproteobacteria bacterium]
MAAPRTSSVLRSLRQRAAEVAYQLGATLLKIADRSATGSASSQAPRRPDPGSGAQPDRLTPTETAARSSAATPSSHWDFFYWDRRHPTSPRPLVPYQDALLGAQASRRLPLRPVGPALESGHDGGPFRRCPVPRLLRRSSLPTGSDAPRVSTASGGSEHIQAAERLSSGAPPCPTG